MDDSLFKAVISEILLDSKRGEITRIKRCLCAEILPNFSYFKSKFEKYHGIESALATLFLKDIKEIKNYLQKLDIYKDYRLTHIDLDTCMSVKL